MAEGESKFREGIPQEFALLKEEKNKSESAQVDKQTGIYTDEEREQWAVREWFNSTFPGIDFDTYKDKLSSSSGRDRRGKPSQLYKVSDAEKEVSRLRLLPKIDTAAGIYIDPDTMDEWVSTRFFYGKGRPMSQKTFREYSSQISQRPGRTASGSETILYNWTELRGKLPPRANEDGVYIDPETDHVWVAKEYLRSQGILNRKEFARYLVGIPERKGRAHRGRDIILYDFTILEQKLPARVDEEGIHTDPKTGKQYASIRFLQRLFPSYDYYTIQNQISDLPSVVGKRDWVLYDIELAKERIQSLIAIRAKSPKIDSVTDIYTDPETGEGYGALGYFLDHFGIDYITIQRRVLKFGIQPISGFGRRGFHVIKLYNIREVLEILGEDGYFAMRRFREERVKNNKKQNDLKQFATEIAVGATLSAQEFRQLIGFFGASRAAVLLYLHRPEFRGIPVERVKTVLADYLGDFLAVKGGFRLEDMEVGAKFLSDKDLQEGLFEVVKESCLAYYNGKRKEKSEKLEFEIIEEYIADLRGKTAPVNNDIWNAIIDRVHGYYRSVCIDIQRPVGIVQELKSGRAFPDINQRINIREITEKKRILIADEMGLGKSASAILAKEHLGLGCALIAAPANVIETWQTYLSDDIERGGYFEEGCAPRVLVVEDLDTLRTLDPSEDDYVLISHERLKDEYVDLLEGMDFDMMIVDEVHKLKNVREGVRAESFLQLAVNLQGENKYLALLSGTPVPNKIEDVAIILRLLYPEKFEDMDNKELVHAIIRGDLVDLQNLLFPRMQMKGLAESIDIPPLTEQTRTVTLSQLEEDVYEVLMEEDELTATQKIQILRQFLLNPELLDSTPGIEGSKIQALDEEIQNAFREHDKVVVFVNGYIEGVIRGEKTIQEKLHLPEGVEIRVIEGEISLKERRAIQKELKTSGKRILLLVSGSTADVGVDFSGGEVLIFYNEPWTEFDKDQEQARVYREGITGPLTSTTLVTEKTIEEGINEFILVKERAVLKLLRGIPITELEQKLLEKTEKQVDPDLEVNPELAEYYFSSWDKLMKIFGYVKQIGQEKFLQFLEKYARAYADCYTELGSRSYQANASRVVGTLIDRFVHERGETAEQLKIVDLASGPEMLKRHMGEEYADRIFSIDINRLHFAGEGGKRVVGGITQVPLEKSSVDYVNLSLALHYTTFTPSKGDLERLEVLTEMNRVLKKGGRAVINLIYSLELQDVEKFKTVAGTLGFRIVEEYSGEIQEGQRYQSRVITLEKENDLPMEEGKRVTDIDALMEQIGRENRDGLKFDPKKDVKLKDTRRILQSFRLGSKTIDIRFNEHDRVVLQEEQSVMAEGEALKKRYKTIHDIPREEILAHGFVRLLIEKHYILFKKLEKGSGVVIIKEK